MPRLLASLRSFGLRRLVAVPGGLVLLAVVSPSARAQWVVNGSSYSLASGSATLGGSDYGAATSYSQTGGTVSGSTLEFGYVLGGTSNSGTNVTYNLSAGAFSMSNLTLGVTGSYYGSGYFSQTGGTASIAGTLRLGAGTGSNTGQYAISGGNLTVGTLSLTGRNSITNARFALNGGTLITSNVTTGASGYPYGLLIFNGGTLQADANAGSPGSGWINSGTTTYVSTGGALIDTAGTDRTINAALVRDPFLAVNQPDAGLTKLGTGTLTLNAASTYTGNTTIKGGLIEFGFASALGASTNQVVLDGGGLRWATGNTDDISSRLAAIGAGGGTFDTNGNNVAFGTALSGIGALAKTGAGTLTLNAASTYGGAFTVGAGTLSLGNALALQNSNVTLAGSGALDVNVFSAVTLGNLNATSFALQNDYPAPLALTLGGGNTTATSATAFSGAGSLGKTGTGTITLSGANTYTGGTTVSAGTLQFANPAALPSSGTLTVASGATAAFNVGGSGEFTSSTLGSAVGSATFQNGSRLGLDTTNAAAGRFTFSDALSGSLGLAKLGSGFLTLTGANSYTGGTTVSAGGLTGNTASLQGNIVNNAAVYFDQSSDGTYAGNMSGTGSLFKSYAGNLTLAGTNTYSGGTTVSTGTLTGNTTSLQGNIANNAALAFDQASTGTYAGVISGSGSVTKIGAGNLTLAGANTYSGGTTVSAGTLTGNASSLQGNIADNAALVFDQASAGTYAGAISGSGSVTKSNAGNLTLSGANTYTGGTTVSAGTLTGNATSLQGNIANNAALVFDQASAGTYAGVVSGTGTLTKSNSGTLSLPGANTFTGGTTVSAGTLQIGAGGTAGSLAGNITNNSALAFNRSDASTYSGVISGTGTLTKLGGGTLTLTGASTYTGATALNGGLVEFSAANNFGTGSITLNGGGLRWATGNTTDLSGRLTTYGASGATFDTNGNNVTFATAHSGGALTKTGAGTLPLPANNTYTGGTTVNAGTLVLGTGGSVGAIVGALTINAGATLATSTPNAFGYATGSKVDSVTINGGTLAYTGAGDLGWGVAYTLSNGATMSSNGGVSSASAASGFSFGGPNGGNTSVNVTAGTATIAGHVDLRGDNSNPNVNVTVASGATLNVTAGISSHTPDNTTVGPVGFTKLGAGTMTLTGANTYTGGTAINAGTLQAGNASAFGTGPISFGGGTLQYGSGITNDFSSLFSTAASQAYKIDTNGNAVTLATALTSSGGSLTKSGSGTLTLTAANTYTGGTTVNAGTLALGFGSGGVGTIRGALTIGSGATVVTSAVDGFGFGAGTKIDSVTINGGTLNHTAAGNQGWGVAYTLSNGATLTSNGGTSSTSAASAFAFGNSTSVNVTDGTNTIAGRVDLRGDLGDTAVGFTVASGATLNVTAGISSSGGSVGVTKLGAGTMTLTGTNTYAGTTAINAGTLQAGNASALGSGTISFGGGTLQYGSGVTTDFSSRFSAAASQAYNIDTNGQNVSFATALGSDGVLTKTGAGTLTLAASTNALRLAATVNADTLVLGQASSSSVHAIGSGLTINSGGTARLGGSGGDQIYQAVGVTLNSGGALDLNGRSEGFDTLTGSGTVTNTAAATGILTLGENNGSATFGGVLQDGAGTVALVKTGTGTLTLTGAETHTGGTTISAGTLQIGNGGTTGSVAGNITDNATLAFNRSDALTYSGVVSGTGALTKLGSGNLTLSGANTYSGGTTVSAGTLMGNTTSLQRNITDNAALVFDQASAGTYAGVVSGTGSFTKSGSGTLTLTGANTYTGATNVSAGTLRVNGSLAHTALTVASGATLGGSGSIGGAAEFLSGAHLAPGNSPGTLTFTNGLALDAGAILDFELGPTSDLIRVSGGTLTGPSSGLVTLNLTNAGGFTAASYTLFDFSGATTSSFTASDFTFGTTIAGYTYSLALVGSTLQLTTSAIPEPATYAAALAVAALCAALVRRRRTQTSAAKTQV